MVATELGVDPSFVEKDWHAIRLVATVAGVREGDLALVFSGGTSLSKGYGLIRRFSEDLDFRVLLPEPASSDPLVAAIEARSLRRSAPVMTGRFLTREWRRGTRAASSGVTWVTRRLRPLLPFSGPNSGSR